MVKPKANKNDRLDNKPELKYICQATLAELSYAMMAGKIKYGKYNYLKGHNASQLLEAAIRHLFAVLNGEYLDADCTERLGHPVSHLGCVLANINMLLSQQEAGTLNNDVQLSLAQRAKNLLDNESDSVNIQTDENKGSGHETKCDSSFLSSPRNSFDLVSKSSKS